MPATESNALKTDVRSKYIYGGLKYIGRIKKIKTRTWRFFGMSAILSIKTASKTARTNFSLLGAYVRVGVFFAFAGPRTYAKD